MKKIYFNPKMEVVDLKINQQLLVGSTDAPVGGGSQGNGSALAPGMYWDDDDEEDEYY